MMREKDLSLILLFDCYAEVLKPSQREIFDLYYNDDLSLSEIAEQCGITRQGVRDALKRAEEELTFMEEKLSLLKRSRMQTAQMEAVKEHLASLRLHTDTDGLSLIGQIETELDALGS